MSRFPGQFFLTWVYICWAFVAVTTDLVFLCVLGRLSLLASQLWKFCCCNFYSPMGESFFSPPVVQCCGESRSMANRILGLKVLVALVESLQTCDILRACLSLTEHFNFFSFLYYCVCKSLMHSFNGKWFFQRILESDPSLGFLFVHWGDFEGLVSVFLDTCLISWPFQQFVCWSSVSCLFPPDL